MSTRYSCRETPEKLTSGSLGDKVKTFISFPAVPPGKKISPGQPEVPKVASYLLPTLTPFPFLLPFEDQILPSLNEARRAGEYPIPPGTYPGVWHLKGRLRHDQAVTATRMVLVARAWPAGWYTFTRQTPEGRVYT